MSLEDQNMSFEDLNLHPKILKAIAEAGYTKPTPIQEDAIPIIMSGRDLRASAQTGTGKTAAFMLPTLNKLAEPSELPGKGPRVLILVPTRELAMQVATEAMKYSKYLSRMKTVCLYGGVPYPMQIRDLARPYEILVATPGRLLDHCEQKRIDFSRLELFILDEADRMLDMGFIQSVEQLAATLPETVQTLMFSATLKGNIYKLSERLLKNPLEVSVTPVQQNKDNIQQHLYFVDSLSHKLQLLDHLLQNQALEQTIIFTSTKRYAEQLVTILQENGHQAAALHGDMNQHKRSQTILRIRQGKTRILVATDVAARGIDVQAIGHVINFDLPINVEDYVHRIGRTGRAEAKGVAISFAAPNDMLMLKRIEQYIEQAIIPHVIEGMEAQIKPNFSSPRSKPRGGRGFGGGNGGYRGNSGSGGGGYRGSNSSGGGGYRGSNSSSNGGGYRGNSSEGGGYRGNSSNGGGYRGNSNDSSGNSSAGNSESGSGYRGNGNSESGSGYRGNGNSESGSGYRGNGNSESGSGYRGSGNSGAYNGNGGGGARPQRRSFDSNRAPSSKSRYADS